MYEAVQDQSTKVYSILHNVYTLLYFRKVQNIEQVTGDWKEQNLPDAVDTEIGKCTTWA